MTDKHFPDRATAQEFYTNVIALGEMARDCFIEDMKQGRRSPSFSELREIEINLEVCRAELQKYL